VYPQQPAAAKEEKSAGVAAILSFIFTGSGQVYNGDLLRGIGILVGTIIGSFIFLIPGIIVWIYGIYDAYTTAQKMNRGEIPFKPTNVGLVIGFIVVYILIAIAMVFFVFLAMLSSGNPYYY
jgi:TM2 domain-containing membrane protein YozV